MAGRRTAVVRVEGRPVGTRWVGTHAWAVGASGDRPRAAASTVSVSAVFESAVSESAATRPVVTEVVAPTTPEVSRQLSVRSIVRQRHWQAQPCSSWHPAVARPPARRTGAKAAARVSRSADSWSCAHPPVLPAKVRRAGRAESTHSSTMVPGMRVCGVLGDGRRRHFRQVWRVRPPVWHHRATLPVDRAVRRTENVDAANNPAPARGVC